MKTHTYINSGLSVILSVVKDRLSYLHNEIGESDNSKQIIEDFLFSIETDFEELSERLEADREEKISEPYEREYEHPEER